ncbi:hypothetical protein D044_2507B, partial [Vibrio parahaemolyticus EKP-026]
RYVLLHHAQVHLGRALLGVLRHPQCVL